MSLDRAWNAYIFRDGKVTTSGAGMVQGLAERLLVFNRHSSSRTALIDILLRAGELECALCDAQSAHIRTAEAITDTIAHALVAQLPLPTQDILPQLETIAAPDQVQVAVPEGFAYYSLHPLDIVDLVRGIPRRSPVAAIIGIRSIGTTLSSVVLACFRTQGVEAERITVRPQGHPYERQTNFSTPQLQWIAGMLAKGAEFLVVDEGPGMSGSSFLSVGDALVAAEVPRGQIAFLCTRYPDPDSLTAPHAARRWPAFNAYYTLPTRHLPARAKHYVAGGIWRAKAFSSEADWPASWTQLERLKFLSEDGTVLYRFEGFGRFGEDVYQRAVKIGEGGFGPEPYPREEGFGVYPMLRGTYLSANSATPAVLARLAEYCAFRARCLGAEVAHTPELETMFHFNTREEFGVDVPLEVSRLIIERPVIADGRMLPHKWIATGNTFMKLDASTHGDDHFFPGPTDIAWDLAGTIVEWDLSREATDFFLDCYRMQSDDDAAPRLPAYLLAYSIFRTSYCKMASAAMNGAADGERFRRDYHRYREQAKAFVENTIPDFATKADQTAAA